MNEVANVEVVGQTMTIELYDAEFNEAECDYQDVIYEYVNIKGHQVGQHWVAVFTEDDKTVVLPASRIKRIIVSQG